MMRILIADDNPGLRGVLRSFLEKAAGVQVCGEAQSGYETIQAALSAKPDLIILDVIMPKLNGIETASILKKVLPATRILLFTMYDDYVGSLASTIGVDYIVSKPEGISPLLSAVKDVLAGNGATQC